MCLSLHGILDGTSWWFQRRERPQLHFDAEGIVLLAPKTMHILNQAFRSPYCVV